MLLIKRSKRGQVTFTKCKGEVQKLANFCKMVNIKSSCGRDRKKEKTNYLLKNTQKMDLMVGIQKNLTMC